MSKLAVFFAEGYEEIEALTVVDLCRRSGIETDMVAVSGEEQVTGSHGITVKMDKALEEIDFDTYEMLVLPGGMPGTLNLEANEKLMQQVDSFLAGGKYVAAICAAPSILGHRGILRGRKACSYPGFEGQLEGAEVTKEPVAVAGKVVTSRGMGTAIDFGLAIVEIFCGAERARQLAESIVYR